jgi:hypothetical protein
MSAPPKDLFKRHATPPTPLHDAVQKWAKKEGWSPPWDGEEQKKAAGKKSGIVRKTRAKLRLSIIHAAYSRLKPTYKSQPFSSESIDALEEEYLSLLGKADGSSSIPLTEDRLDSYASAILAIPQLPAVDRSDALQDDYYIFLRGTPLRRKPMTDDELDLNISVLLAIADLPEADRHALQKVSHETLRSGLNQLGIKGKRPAQHPG